MNEQVIQKLKILTESAKYDVSCASSGTSRKNTRGGVGNTVGGWGICHSFSESGNGYASAHRSGKIKVPVHKSFRISGQISCLLYAGFIVK